MPGVPRSRGCNSCLKQKKKCDQSKPACSRCARLGIPCVGSGEQKYVFKPVSFTKPFKHSIPKAQKREKSSQVSMLHKPQNSLILLQAKLVAALEITDFRYGLSCYGGFLEHVPRRLGHSHALDISVDLMMSALPYHYTHEIPSQILAKYSGGLKVLRGPQDENGTQLSPEDAAAFHIMVICQSWLGQADDDLKSHGQLLARFIDTATEKGWSSTFELKLLEASAVALFFEALVDPRIDLEQHILMLDAFKYKDCSGYRDLCTNLLQVTEVILLTTALALNSILRAAYPDDSVLLLEASTLANKLITLAKAAYELRPLGASYILPCLVTVWAMSSSLETQQNEIEALVTEYQRDYARIKWMDQAGLLEALHGTLLERVSESNSRDKVKKSDIDGNLETLIVHSQAVFGSIGSYFFPSS
ncbi:hypothetical protein FACUT_1923 [Fusarium acutatum]|uniref:Zn(2)-C6 fungal-type domain-containing protein n=1 Tax=Fusarium acutatum TaxID=78861 RepID=A0A8H4K3A8_9HYPO|nr:hypothetical protein FACUT_1923 [Fusarium acutatum]